MSKKAVDIVLLPGGKIVYKVIRLNRQLLARFDTAHREEFGAEIVLDEENCLPHISLAMGCIEEGDIFTIAKVLTSIAKENPVGKLQVIGVRVSENARGERVSSLEVVRTEKLQRLHEKIMEQMEPYFSYDVTEDMLYPSGEIAESTLDWIRNYRLKSSFGNFWPHITLGYGVMGDAEFPVKLDISKFALCHLGNHCTCRKILVPVVI